MIAAPWMNAPWPHADADLQVLPNYPQPAQALNYGADQNQLNTIADGHHVQATLQMLNHGLAWVKHEIG